MAFPLIPIAISLASKFAPSLLGKLFGDKAEETAEQVVGIAKSLTGTNDPDGVVQALESRPELVLQYREALMNLELEIYREDTKRLEAVNATMQTESQSEHWPQYSWRPMCGFSFPLLIGLIYFLLPMLGKAVPEVPEYIWIGFGAILGVATWDRGKEKRVRAGEEKDGMITGVIKAIRGESAEKKNPAPTQSNIDR